MIIYNIGFTGKNAEEFFTLLVKNNVKRLIDVRLNNVSQLAGFANAKHLPYLLKVHNIEYCYMPNLAPTKDILDNYKKKGIMSWEEYEEKYNKLLIEREIAKNIDINFFANSVLLCSECTAECCHRRLVCEYLQKNFKNINIKEL
ncbi:MAG: DUF488 domain-containing protein [Campylobacter sp.]|uniref:DUF488 domain-containing protein n=1 Tax=Campylobacter sp. TaxID=205 RepID=UPI002A76566D|nr:DUF488 domain-containing protein [Campylobacter sp.]MCI7247621.1 DUF488 domain-containing protein [Campylobacter sp.]MDY2764228.1 DUF488 domain-containing protein [Campylobacter sp.]